MNVSGTYQERLSLRFDVPEISPGCFQDVPVNCCDRRTILQVPCWLRWYDVNLSRNDVKLLSMPGRCSPNRSWISGSMKLGY